MYRFTELFALHLAQTATLSRLLSFLLVKCIRHLTVIVSNEIELMSINVARGSKQDKGQVKHRLYGTSQKTEGAQ